MLDTKKYPILAARIEDGSIIKDDHRREYVGKASDGMQVNIGTVGYENAVENYLSAHQTPDTW